MKWNKFTIKTTTEAEDYLSAMLDEIGVEGIEIEDNVPLSKEDQSAMFIDFLPELPQDDGTSKVSFYIDAENDYEEILEQVKAGIEEWRQFVDIGEGSIIQSETEDIDWQNNWKEFFKAFTIDDILIKPTWEELKEEDKGRILIEIDPGVSFGTGKHETTQLCIRQLRKYMKDSAKVLDVGCGSGILSIVALKLGAGEVVGTDIDKDCIMSANENLKVNHLENAKTEFYVGNLIDDTQLQQTVGNECYDIVVANILADVIIPMAPVIPARLKKGGIFITSGIIDFKEQEVKEALEKAGFEILETNYQGEWVNITAKNVKVSAINSSRRREDMHQFFVDREQIGTEYITITGEDVKHIKNVLRMKEGEEVRISDGAGGDFFCTIEKVTSEEVLAKILPKEAGNTELPNRIFLFQAVPKGERMEYVIQKAVELGVYEIIPVEMKYCVVRLDDKKKEKKRQSPQTIRFM